MASEPPDSDLALARPQAKDLLASPPPPPPAHGQASAVVRLEDKAAKPSKKISPHNRLKESQMQTALRMVSDKQEKLQRTRTHGTGSLEVQRTRTLASLRRLKCSNYDGHCASPGAVEQATHGVQLCAQECDCHPWLYHLHKRSAAHMYAKPLHVPKHRRRECQCCCTRRSTLCARATTTPCCRAHAPRVHVHSWPQSGTHCTPRPGALCACSRSTVSRHWHGVASTPRPPSRSLATEVGNIFSAANARGQATSNGGRRLQA